MFNILGLLILLNIFFIPLPKKFPGDATLIEVRDPLLLEELTSASQFYFPLQNKTFSIKEHSSDYDLADSGAGSHIYFILSEKTNLLGVLKIVEKEPPLSNDFLREEKALFQLLSTPFKHFHPIPFRGMGEFILHDKTYLMLAESPAPGKSLNTYLKAYRKTSSLKDHKQICLILKKGVYEVGLSLGEIHKQAKKPFTHGDLHPGNIFYNLDTNQVFFIDFGKTAPLPEGSLHYHDDVATFLYSLEALGAYYGLSLDEYKELESTFFKGYETYGPKILEKSYHHYRNNLIRYYASSSFLSEQDDRQNAQARFLYHYSKSAL